MDKLMLLKGVRLIPGNKPRPLRKYNNGESFEIKLEFPESELTRLLGHTSIHTIIRYKDVKLDKISDDFASYVKTFNDITHAVQKTMELDIVVMDLEVVLYHYANVKASSVNIVSMCDNGYGWHYGCVHDTTTIPIAL
jgi:hypothetical protein